MHVFGFPARQESRGGWNVGFTINEVVAHWWHLTSLHGRELLRGDFSVGNVSKVIKDWVNYQKMTRDKPELSLHKTCPVIHKLLKRTKAALHVNPGSESLVAACIATTTAGNSTNAVYRALHNTPMTQMGNYTRRQTSKISSPG
jgi:hypothetical protein